MNNKKLTPSELNQIMGIAFEKGKHLIPPDPRHQAGKEIIGEINQIDVSLFNLEQFTEKVVNLIRDGFELYYIGLYLASFDRKRAVLQAGSGKIGQLLKEQSNPIFLSADNDVPVSEAIRFNKARLVDGKVYETKPYMLHPFLADTQVEIAIPIRTKDEVIGALKICSCIPGSLSEKDFPIFSEIGEGIASKCSKLLPKSKWRTEESPKPEFLLMNDKEKQKVIQRIQGYWQRDQFLEAGISLFERIPRKHRSVWASNILKVVYEYSPRSEQIEAVIDLGHNRQKWIDENIDWRLEAHTIVDEVNELHYVTQAPLPKTIFTLAKNVGKVIYNAHGYSAPFDHSAGWEIAKDLSWITALVNAPDFPDRAWSVFSDKKYIELGSPIECSGGCPVCRVLFDVYRFGEKETAATVGGKHI